MLLKKLHKFPSGNKAKGIKLRTICQWKLPFVWKYTLAAQYIPFQKNWTVTYHSPVLNLFVSLAFYVLFVKYQKWCFIPANIRGYVPDISMKSETDNSWWNQCPYGYLYCLLDYVSLKDHNALSHDFKFLTATVIFTEHGINAMPLEANPTISPFLMVSK
jgi:hypothetical protein